MIKMNEGRRNPDGQHKKTEMRREIKERDPAWLKKRHEEDLKIGEEIEKGKQKKDIEPEQANPPDENEYFCEKCGHNHRLDSNIGKEHLELDENKNN